MKKYDDNQPFGRKTEEDLHGAEKHGRERRHVIQEKVQKVSNRTQEIVTHAKNETKSGASKVADRMQEAGMKVRNRVQEGATHAAHTVSEKTIETMDKVKEKIR